MEPDRWKEIEKVYHQALEREETERETFLQEACQGDEGLRREVETLLGQQSEAQDFLDTPALEMAAQEISKEEPPPLVGRQIGPYKILSLLGKGGMGEVYLAQDTQLDRKVALKSLPEAFSGDPERLARFEREAKLLASLNHPNIATIHGLEELDGRRLLVMELVEGKDLSELLKWGPLSVDEGLKVALQIAEGLEAAHTKGIIHRDLKPDNIKISSENKIKILDFGLAKALEKETPATDASHSQTLTDQVTRAGVVLGTAPYMSPEQAKGKLADKRTDIWAFGAVLFEMLTGKRAFGEGTVTETLAKILEGEPDWQELPGNVPGVARTLLRRSLEKDLQNRIQHIADARILIEEALNSRTTATPPEVSSRLGIVPWALLGLMAAALVAVLSLWWTSHTVQQTPIRLHVRLPPNQFVASNVRGQAVALSSNGERLAYMSQVIPYGGAESNGEIYVRSLDQLESRRLFIEESGATRIEGVFFSPDGEWLGFGAGGKLKKLSVSGGAALTLCDLEAFQGASWGPDDTIIFSRSVRGGLWRIPASGGTPEQITVPETEEDEDSHRYPQILPGGKMLLFSAGQVGRFDEANIVALSLETGEQKIVHRGGYYPRYVSTGHLIFVREGSLFAVPFDLAQLEATGPPKPILESISSDPEVGAAHLDFSETGNLVYRSPGGERDPKRALVWVNRQGREEPLAADPASYLDPRISPDGSRMSITIDESGNDDIWIYDLSRNSATRLTFNLGDDRRAIWTPDGLQVVFLSRPAGERGTGNLFWKAADGTGEVERLTTSPQAQVPHFWSQDGKSLVFEEQDPETQQDLRLLSMQDTSISQPLLKTQFIEDRPAISPDGRWVAYRSNESGQFEIYVRPFPRLDEGRWQVSLDGGISTLWAPNGEELYYRRSTDGAMMVVPVETDPTFTIGTSEVLFTGNYFRSRGRNYDISPDGRRFLMIKELEQFGDNEFVVVLNWFEELKRLVPTD